MDDVNEDHRKYLQQKRKALYNKRKRYENPAIHLKQYYSENACKSMIEQCSEEIKKINIMLKLLN